MTSSCSANYQVGEADYDTLDTILYKIIAIIYRDEEDVLTASWFVEKLTEMQSHPKISPKWIAYSEVLIDDLEYEYYLGEYAEDYWMQPSDCYDDEYYDEQDQMCYLSEDEEEGWSGLLGFFSWVFHDNHTHDHFEEGTVYEISGDELISGSEIPQRHQELWNMYTQIITSIL